MRIVWPIDQERWTSAGCGAAHPETDHVFEQLSIGLPGGYGAKLLEQLGVDLDSSGW